jgi:hypothetical protein
MSQGKTAPLMPEPTIEIRRRPLGKRILQIIRRLHLYAGLFMIPWVILYAFTGLLFNHGLWLPEHPTLTFGPEVTQGTPLDGLPDAETLAGEVIAAVRERGRAEGRSSNMRLVEPERAMFEGDILAAKSVGGGTAQDFVFYRTGGGFVRCRRDTETSPFDCAAGVFGSQVPSQRIRQALPMVSDRLGLPAGETSVEFLPQLIFFAEAEGVRWRVRYDPKSGQVQGKPADAPTDKAATRFLKELHFSAGYPVRTGNPRWFWAVAVDATVFSMFFWAVSGIFMWWQIKAVRLSGVGVLLTSAVLASVLVVSMHRLLMF